MSNRLEHVNLTVSSLENTLDFLLTAIPTFRVRGEGVGPNGSRWMHVGSDSSYLALNEATGESDSPGSCRWRGVNHLGFEVEDADSVRRQLLARGYREGFLAEAHPYRKRVYFHDPDDNEWEFVEYFTDDPAKRNEYS